MSSPDIGEFASYAQDLIRSTANGDMSWTRVNPTTFYWETKVPAPARLVLQKVEHQERAILPTGQITIRRTLQFVFQATDMRTGQQRVAINGSENSQVNEVLGELYRTIETGVTRQGLEFLKALIPKK